MLLCNDNGCLLYWYFGSWCLPSTTWECQGHKSNQPWDTWELTHHQAECSCNDARGCVMNLILTFHPIDITDYTIQCAKWWCEMNLGYTWSPASIPTPTSLAIMNLLFYSWVWHVCQGNISAKYLQWIKNGNPPVPIKLLAQAKGRGATR